MMRRWCFWLGSSWLLAASAAAEKKPAGFVFPEITSEQAALTQVEGFPEAVAVVLFRRGKFAIELSPKYGLVTTVEVHSRLKVLKESAKSYGDLEIPHHPLAQFESLDGRTILPDGRVLPLPRSAVFRDQLTKSGSVAVIRAALPAVEVGAILDIHYRFRADSFYFLEPWLFQDEIPVLYSEAEFLIPYSVRSRKYLENPLRLGLMEEKREVEDGTAYRVWAENLPPRLNEPYSFAKLDLTTRLALVPDAYTIRGYSGLGELGWRQLGEGFQAIFAKAAKDDGSARRLARSLTSAASGASKKEQALILYQHVRDKVGNVPAVSFGMSGNPDVDNVLKRKMGTPLEKALLLQALLGTLEVPVEILLAASTDAGTLSPSYPTLIPFERVLVAVELDGTRLLTDPSDRCLTLGQLPPAFEQASAMRTSNGQLIRFAATGSAANSRHADLELKADEAGSLRGSGTLKLAGHHAVFACSRVEGESDAQKSWREYLEIEHPGFDVSEVAWKNEVDERNFTLTWKMSLREEEQLGDEISYKPSRPLGPVRQPFTLTAEERKTAVLLPFADADDLKLTLSWAPGWEPETLPSPVSNSSSVGELSATIVHSPDGDSLHYRRRLEVRQSRFNGKEEYSAIRDLYAQAEAHDAQVIVLSRD